MKDIFWKLMFDILKNHLNFIMKSKRFGACLALALARVFVDGRRVA